MSSLVAQIGQPAAVAYVATKVNELDFLNLPDLLPFACLNLF